MSMSTSLHLLSMLDLRAVMPKNNVRGLLIEMECIAVLLQVGRMLRITNNSSIFLICFMANFAIDSKNT